MKVKVFVSSTFRDLKEHRAAVREVLHRMKAEVDAMEYFGSLPDTPESACFEEIEACDVLIGIYAWRYGWQPDPDGPSITEQEFDRAVQAGKKCLCYVVDPEWPWKLNFVDGDDAGRRLEAFKAKVGKLVVSSFSSPDDLAKRVAADLSNLLHKEEPGLPASPLTPDYWKSFPPDARREVIAILRSLPDEESGAGPSITTARFVARPEYFGSLIFDRENTDSIPFDQEATDVFRLLGKKSLNQIYELLPRQVSLEHYRQFVALCQSIQMMDEQERFQGVFLESVSPPQGRLSAPIRVHLACTNACNLNCSHCYADSGRPEVGELTTGEIRRLIADLAEMGCLHLSLGGGEPLLRADLAELVGTANENGVAVRIATNATAATPEVVNTLRGFRIEAFRVSMEGSSDPVYDAIRGEAGSFRAALAGIERLKSLGCPIELHRVLMSSNTSDLRELVDLAVRLGASAVVLDTVVPVGRAAERVGISLSRELVDRVWVEVEAIKKDASIPVWTPHRAPFQIKRFFPKLGCECGNLICHIDARGRVFPTGMARAQIPAGELRHNSFRQIWNNDQAFGAFRMPCSTNRCRISSELAQPGSAE